MKFAVHNVQFWKSTICSLTRPSLENLCDLGQLTPKKATAHDTNFVPSEVLLDPCRTWCPSSTCQAVCQLKEADSPALPQLVQCAVCALEFCSACKANWHPGQACQENNLPITSFLPGENRYSTFLWQSIVKLRVCGIHHIQMFLSLASFLVNDDSATVECPSKKSESNCFR